MTLERLIKSLCSLLAIVGLGGVFSPVAAAPIVVHSVRASCAHPYRPAENLINDSGMDSLERHDNNWANMWLSSSGPAGSQPRGGTVAGSFWVEFDLGQTYSLDAMKIWNYNELNWPWFGMKEITIEYSTNGGIDPADWTAIYTGVLPSASSGGTGVCDVSLTVDFNQVQARYVVITAALPPNHNHRSDLAEVGLSEVRFYGDNGSGGLSWRDAELRATLANAALEAKFQAGHIYQLRNPANDDYLINLDPASLNAVLSVFGPTSVNLGTAAVEQTVATDSIQTVYSWTDGTSLTLHCSLDGDDLVLQMAGQAPNPVGGIFYTLPGCALTDYKLVMVDVNGVGHEHQGPSFYGFFPGDVRHQVPASFSHPLVALFQGANSGWFVEGRDGNLGTSIMGVYGQGAVAELTIARGYFDIFQTTQPELFEVRIRNYVGAWQDAVDPYIDWMKNDVGFVPLEEKHLPWIKDIRTQAYVTCTDFAGLNALAQRVDPAKTYLGRQAEFRYYGFDKGFPDYSVTPQAADWIGQARDLGFHVGVHINIGGIDWSNTALLQQMQPGLQQIGTDAQGNPIWDGASTHAYCSAAYAPWRAHLIAAIADVVAAGADVIYLDQTNGVLGKFVVDGMTGVAGVIRLQEEILAAYPHVTIQTEQFNPMASRHAGFALSQMPLGHPLSGYIFSPFIHIVPEGWMYSPVDLPNIDAFNTYGYMLPGSAPAIGNASWMEIVDAFQQYDLVADSRLPRNAQQQFGYVGAAGVTAYFEKTANSRGLVVYSPGQEPIAYGVRYTNITEWPGPGAIRDWLIYDGATLLGLDPATTYWFEDITLDQDRFHLTAVPADYAPHTRMERRIVTQEVGADDNYFRIFFSGHGQVRMHVPDEYDVYLDNQLIPVNRSTQTAIADVAVTPPNYAVIRAFRRSEKLLQGYWAGLPWSVPAHISHYVSTAGSRFPPHGFFTAVAGVGVIVGKMPVADSIRLQGAFGMRDDALNSQGAGVVRINGQEILRVGPGQGPPYSMYPFDVDVTAFAGQYVILEFACDGAIHGADYADWDAPRIVVTGMQGQGVVLPPDKIAAAASSSHSARPPVRTIDLSGMTGDTHDNSHQTMWLSGAFAASAANPHPGTVAGSHWIRFDFDQIYHLNEVWLWNYNESGYPWFGMREVTMQHSTTGGADPSAWATFFVGVIPSAAGVAASPVDMILSLPAGTPVRHVVITAAAADSGLWNWSSLYEQVGLSEVRFYVEDGPVAPLTCAEAIALGYAFPGDFNEDCRVDWLDLSMFGADWLRCIDPADPVCERPWQP